MGRNFERNFGISLKIKTLLLIILLIIVNVFSGNLLSYAESGKDVSALVNVSPVSMDLLKGSAKIPIIKDGVHLDDAPNIKVGDAIELKYLFHISEESMKKISDGDYFTIDLPDVEYINTVEGDFDIRKSDGDLLGKYTIQNGVLKASFINIGSEIEAEDGWFLIDGNTIKSGKNISIGNGGNINLDIEPNGNTGGGSSGGNDAGKNEIKEEKVKFSKDGKQYLGRNILNWHLNVNYDGLRQMIMGDAVAAKNDVILEDTLPQNVSADIKSVYITAPLFVPTPDNKMSGYSIGYIKITPEVLKAGNNESYEEFYQRLRQQNKVVVGIYDINGYNSIFFSFGDLPGNGLTYSDLLGGENALNELIDSHVRSGDITEEQSQRMKAVYGENGNSQGQILGYDVSFDTAVSGESGEYKNFAHLDWNTDDQNDSVYIIAFNKTESGIIVSKKINVSVKKEWIGAPKDEIKVYLLADGEKKAEIELSDKNNWHYTFEHLDKYKSNGSPIKYTVEEEVPGGYTNVISGNQNDGYVITNTNVEKLNIPVTKTWVGKAGSEAVIKLLADGKEKETVTLTEANSWKHEFKNLAKYDSKDGHEIKYEIKEVKVNGYNTEINGSLKDGFTITNTIEGKVSIPVTKTWVGKAGSEAVIKLLADGKVIDRVTLNDNNHWQHTFENLEKYNKGVEIKYTVEEEKVAGYTSKITGNAEEGYIVVNTENEIPNTGDRSDIISHVLLFILSVMEIICIFFRKNRLSQYKGK